MLAGDVQMLHADFELEFGRCCATDQERLPGRSPRRTLGSSYWRVAWNRSLSSRRPTPAFSLSAWNTIRYSPTMVMILCRNLKSAEVSKSVGGVLKFVLPWEGHCQPERCGQTTTRNEGYLGGANGPTKICSTSQVPLNARLVGCRSCHVLAAR